MASIQDIADITIAQTNDDVSALFVEAIVKRPLLRWLRFGTPVSGVQSEFKWPEEVRQEVTAALGGNYTAASGTVAVAAGDGAKFSAGDQFHIEDHVDTNFVRIIFSVTSITVDSLSVSVVNGLDTSLTLASPAQVIHIVESSADSSAAITSKAEEPTIQNSYLQLIRGKGLILGRKLIRESQGGALQGIDDIIQRGIDQMNNDLSWRVYNAFLYSFGVAETSSTAPAKTKGFLEFVNTSSDNNRINGSAAALSEDMINDLVEKLILLGMPDAELKLMIMSPATVRKVSALRHAKVTYDTDELVFGGAVQEYHSELPGVGALQLITDTNMPDDLSLLVSPDWVEMVPATNRTLVELEEINKDDGSYGREWSLTTELGLKVMYATRYHGAIYNYT